MSVIGRLRGLFLFVCDIIFGLFTFVGYYDTRRAEDLTDFFWHFCMQLIACYWKLVSSWRYCLIVRSTCQRLRRISFRFSPFSITEIICLQRSRHLKCLAPSTASKLCRLAYLTFARHHTASLLLLKDNNTWRKSRCLEPNLMLFFFTWFAILIYRHDLEAFGRSSLTQH